MLRMSDLDLSDKKVLIREDLNVPILNGEISSDARIRAILPTLDIALKANCAILIMSHMGRPTEGEYNSDYSLEPIAGHLSNLLGKEVSFISDWYDGVEVACGEIVLLENVRFEVGEKKNDELLSRKMAELCDIFIMDAFACSHRAHASTCGIIDYAKMACAGPLLSKELDALEMSFKEPKKPVVAIVGGSKVSTKLGVLKSLSGLVDYLILGGGIANTFIKASGYNIGNSLHEESMLNIAQSMLSDAVKSCQIPEIIDVVVAKEFSSQSRANTKMIEEVASDDLILDIGPKTAEIFSKIISQAQTIIWNGPLGVFEFDQFGLGTKAIAKAIAQSKGFSAAGGGDTLAAIEKYEIVDDISYISTGGGAFLEFIEGKPLPSVEALKIKGY
ncbi:phosphoglycerate kinase [Woeseiaceae bacterium]|jgi:phosphoglycerate kinase|nr:phosphoglycerate kinase [Woeseiaceae bacterium]MDB2544651.1 phosphoglycerate kinase [Woeseiaceae bacterium]|tara:strand:+ start:484 stop:1650 length:1167 start_codon:yes stop_codon:yes gene_type:complete